MRQNIFKDIKTIPSTAINSLRNCMKDISGVTLIKKQKLSIAIHLYATTTAYSHLLLIHNPSPLTLHNSTI